MHNSCDLQENFSPFRNVIIKINDVHIISFAICAIFIYENFNMCIKVKSKNVYWVW
jgi:hypothetical protein